MTTLYQITLSYYCIGIEVSNRVVINAPPIARWMIGKPLAKIMPWLARKEAKIVVVDHYDDKGPL
jgi:hypothetical protein